jgi:hypothetical protein
MKKRSLWTGTLTTTVVGSSVVAGGCLNRPIEPLDPRTTSTIAEKVRQTAVERIDILLAIDNSASMADKQQILAEAIPDLVNRLVNPDCIKTGSDERESVASPTEECPTGLKREFEPILDINIGIVSSSLGLANQGCNPTAVDTNGKGYNNNDEGRLIHRANEGTGGEQVATYRDAGFLAWDPAGKREGEKSIDNLRANIAQMVTGTGQRGCGYEQQLESIYRFLVDPAPAVWAFNGSWSKTEQIDEVLLEQREQFLRADSLVAVLLLSDENDCSIADPVILNSGTFYRASATCEGNPNDACCMNCYTAMNSGVPEGCSLAAMKCDEDNDQKPDRNPEDIGDLKCVKHKERYGYDFLYPTSRYVNAFRQTQIDPSRSDLSIEGSKSAVANPLFTDLSGTGTPARGTDMVFVAGIVGVPWEVVAKKNDAGITTSFKDFDELTREQFWEQYVGVPDKAIYPTEPRMRESVEARAGASGDRTVSPPTDLQYACNFKLPTPNPNGADCKDNDVGDPLCNPAVPTEQIGAKAYPGLRELAFLQGLGKQGIVASVCAENTSDKTALNYGYRPAVNAIIERLKQRLVGQCLPRKLEPNAEGEVPCLIVEGSVRDGGPASGTDGATARTIAEMSECDASIGRERVLEGQLGTVVAALNDPLTERRDGVPIYNNFCAVRQLKDDERIACQTKEVVETAVNGWCYVSNDIGEVQGCGQFSGEERAGCEAQVADCPDSEQHLLRFVNKGAPAPKSVQFITCSGDTAD